MMLGLRIKYSRQFSWQAFRFVEVKKLLFQWLSKRHVSFFAKVFQQCSVYCRNQPHEKQVGKFMGDNKHQRRLIVHAIVQTTSSNHPFQAATLWSQYAIELRNHHSFAYRIKQAFSSLWLWKTRQLLKGLAFLAQDLFRILNVC